MIASENLVLDAQFTKIPHYGLGLGNSFVCKRFTVQTFPWSLEFVIQINVQHDTIAVWNLTRPSGLGNYFVCKRFAVQTLLWSLEFVIEINLEHDTIAVWNLARSWSISTLFSPSGRLSCSLRRGGGDPSNNRRYEIMCFKQQNKT